MSGWQLAALLGSGLLSVVLCLAAVYFFRRQIANPLQKMNAWLKGEAQTNRQIDSVAASAELKHLASGVDALLQKVERTTAFMEEIGKGNLQLEFTTEDEKDALSQALFTTRERLLENEEANRQRNWSAEGITQLEELLRKNNSSLDTLAEVVIQFLVQYLKANQGALFLVQEDDNSPYLEMASCYAYDRKKFMEKRLQPGEGLVGQAFLEKAPIYLTEVPQQYTTITSGLGEATPSAIILVPLQVEEKVVGIVELASFSTFDEHQQNFLNKAAQSIASSVMNVQVNMKTSLLLKRSQQQTEELRAQEEEMRQNMEEMETTQEEMARISSEMQGQLTAINHTMATIAFAPDGTILEANENFLQLMGYSLEEMLGEHHMMFVEAKERESDAYKQFWQQLGAGEYKNGEFKRIAKFGKEVFIRGIYTPLFDRKGKVTKVLKLAYDITESKRMELEIKDQLEETQAQEEELRQNMEELSATQEEMSRLATEMEGQLDAINHTMATIAFKPDGTILEANDNFLQLMCYELEEIQQKHHRIFVDQAERESAEYRRFWQELGQGENKIGEFRRLTKAGKEVFIRGIYNPIRNGEGEVVRVLKLAYDITESKKVEQELNGQLSAINQTMATISFKPDGTILEANDNFLALMGYQADEVVGQHHKIFVDAREAKGAAYQQFWKALAKGESKTGDFSRRTKAGEEVLIRGIYNPVTDKSGKVVKVLKLAYVLDSAQA